jgi:hypothetical protein
MPLSFIASMYQGISNTRRVHLTQRSPKSYKVFYWLLRGRVWDVRFDGLHALYFGIQGRLIPYFYKLGRCRWNWGLRLREDLPLSTLNSVLWAFLSTRLRCSFNLVIFWILYITSLFFPNINKKFIIFSCKFRQLIYV